jgi:hypothetical protein
MFEPVSAGVLPATGGIAEAVTSEDACPPAYIRRMVEVVRK